MHPRNLGELQATFSAAATDGSLLDVHMTGDTSRGEFPVLALIFDKRKMPDSKVKIFAEVLKKELPKPDDKPNKLPEKRAYYDIKSDNHTIQLCFYPSFHDELSFQRLHYVAEPADGILNQRYIDDPYFGLIRSAARLTEVRMKGFSEVYGKERLMFKEKIVPAVSAFRNKILTPNLPRLKLEDIRQEATALLDALYPEPSLEEPAPPPLTNAEAAFIEDTKSMATYCAIVYHAAIKNSNPSKPGHGQGR